MSCKKFLLIICPIVRLFANVLAGNDTYPVLNRDKLTIPVQMQLSQKQNFFSQLVLTFLISRLNFEHFGTKDDPHRFCISEITDSENVVR